MPPKIANSHRKRCIKKYFLFKTTLYRKVKSTLSKKLHKSGPIKPHGTEKRKTKFHSRNRLLPLESPKTFPETKMTDGIREKKITDFYTASLPMSFNTGEAKLINSALGPQWPSRDCCCWLLNSSSFFLPHLLGLASCQTSSINHSGKVISFHCSLRTQVLATVFQIFS